MAAAVALAPAVCWAEPWTLGGSVTQQVEYETNALDSTTNEEDAWGSRTIPAFELERRLELTTLRLGASMELVRYPEIDQLDSENYHVDGEARHRRERSEYAINFSFDDEAANDREVDLDLPLGPDVRQQTFSVRPFFSYALTERNDIEVPLNYSLSLYDAPGAVGADDYQRYGGAVNMTQRVDERNTAVVGVLFDHYLPVGPGDHIGYGGTVGWRHEYSPTLQFSAAVGAEHVDPEGAGQSETGLLLNAGLSYRPELGTVSLDYSHSFEPSIRGDLREVDSLRLRGTTAIGERTGLEAALAYLRGSETTVANSGSEVYEASVAANYMVTEDVAIRPSYRFSYEEFGNTDSVSNLVMLGLVWTAPRQTF